MDMTRSARHRSRATRGAHRLSPLFAATIVLGTATTACVVPPPPPPPPPGTGVGIPGVSCAVTPANSFWRADVSGIAPHTSSETWKTSIGLTRGAKADFGAGLWDGGPIGIPYDVVAGNAPKQLLTGMYDDSDDVPYPIPAAPHVEGGDASTGDRHIIMIDKDNCRLYETWSTYPGPSGWGSGVTAGSGATWLMTSNAMRTAGNTSADAAGLQILPGLVRYEEFAAGDIHHAIRITVPVTRTSYLWPASHQAGSTSSSAYPPMGAWMRLKSSVNPANYDPYIRPIIAALKKHGAVIADNGSAFYMSGVPDDRWNNDKLQRMNDIKGSDWEFVDASAIKVANNSYQATTAS